MEDLKLQIPSTKFQINSNTQNLKQYDLDERTLEFAKRVLMMCKALPKNTINFKFIDQIVRSSSSVGANYREANETETQKDFLFRIRICRKEAKETVYWLHLIIANPHFEKRIQSLLNEAGELVKIIATIANKRKVQNE